MIRTDNDIEEILIAWIKLALSNPSFRVIVSNENGKEPMGSFASLLVITSTSVGVGANINTYDSVNDDFKLLSSSLREVDVSLNFYRDNAHENMRQVMHFPNTNASEEFLFDKGLSLFIPDTYRNLDELENDGFIKRSQIDLRLHCASEYVETVNAIDEVPLTVES